MNDVRKTCITGKLPPGALLARHELVDIMTKLRRDVADIVKIGLAYHRKRVELAVG